MSRTIVFDAEADGLLPVVTKCHCIATYCIESGESKLFGPNEIADGLDYLHCADTLVAHNCCGYDFRMFAKLYNWKPGDEQLIVDTMLVSCLLYPEGQHSIDYWARKLHLKQQKVAHEDWSTYTDDMGWRCQSDVLIGTKVYEYFKSVEGYSVFSSALDMEQEVSYIHSQQVIDGVSFDIKKGIGLYKELSEELSSLETKILKDVPPTISIVGVAKSKQEEARLEGMKGQNSHTKSGMYTAINRNYFESEEVKGLQELWDDRNGGLQDDTQDDLMLDIINLRNKECAQGPFTKIKVEQVNLKSSTQVVELLLGLGWKPTEWNNKKQEDGSWKRTSPKLTEDSYSSLPSGLGQDLARYNIVKHRKSMLLSFRKKDSKASGLLSLVHERGDERVGADGFTCGTNTGRYRHFGLVNIPRPSTPYGEEMRELFKVPQGSWLIGVDLSGIEAVVLAHYCMAYKGGQALADEILKGDFHAANAKIWQVDRDTAKSILYALMYGAGAGKLEAIANNGLNGAQIKSVFYKKYPAILELVKSLEKAYASHGSYIKGFDGRRLYIRSKHKLLNTLIQSTAAIIFKEWMIRVDERMPDCAKQVIAMHDELQIEFEGERKDAEYFASRMCTQAGRVGDILKIKVAVTAEAKVGKNWRDTH